MSVVPLHTLHTEDRNRSTSTPHGVATAHFGELRRPLLEYLDHSEVIVGCVAWITDKHILAMLAARPCALVVQKENWWKRTDARGSALARYYATLTGGLPASAFPEPLATKTFRGKPVPNTAVLAPIACVGYGSSAQHSPLMHHKFVVRCSLDADGALVPTAVWTGSQNFSANSNNSFENAVEIHDPVIAAAYLAEFALVASLSEPMNWRLSKPTPKGLGTLFVAPPVPPRKTTTNVVRAGRRRKKKASATAAKKTTTATAKKAATKTIAKRTAAKKSATRALPAKKPATKKAAARKKAS